MLKTRLTVTILFSVLLISFAIWSRPSNNSSAGGELIAVESSPTEMIEIPYEEFFIESLSNSSSTPLSETDLVSRQLFSNYIELSYNGLTSSSNLENLANNFAEGILNAKIQSSQQISIADIKTIPASTENLRKYWLSMSTLRAKYTNQVKERHGSSSLSGDISSPEFQSFMSEAGEMYSQSARELMSISVPESLAINHLQLIRVYFQNADAMRVISNPGIDPIKIYSAINTQVQNSQKEEELYTNIQLVMMANGII